MKLEIIFIFLVAYCYADDFFSIPLYKFKSQRTKDRENTITPPQDSSGNDTVTPPPDSSGNDTVTPPPDSSGNDTVTPPRDGSGNDTVTPPPDSGGNSTSTPPDDSNGNDTTQYRRRRSASLTLTDYYDAEYVGLITVGSTKQTFKMLFDTGSPDLWIPAITCTQDVCVKHTRYNCGTSSTCANLNTAYSIQYGSGAATGTWIQDSVTLAGLTVPKQKFGYISSEPGNAFLNADFDGILGMSYPFNTNEPPVFNNLMSLNLVQPVFSFFLNRNVKDLSKPGGVLTLGGISTGYYTGSITYLPVINKSWWTVALGSVTDGRGNTYASSTTTILDTGTSLLLGPPTAIDSIHQKLGALKDSYGNRYWSCSSISTLPNVIFTMSGTQFPLSSGFYTEAYSNGLCYSTFGYMPSGMTNPGWILGDVFIGAYFTVFNFGTNQVGLARSTSQPANSGQK